jgi:GNAT superfamily N-acetyltransferase
MTPSAQAAAHDANFIEAIGLLAELAPAGSRAAFGAVQVVVSGVPVAFFNAGWVVEPPAPDDLAAAVSHLRGSSVPFVLHVRSDLDCEDTVAGLGLRADGVLPCFALAPRPIPPVPAGLEIRRVGPGEWDDFSMVTATGFGMPRELLDALYSPKMLDLPIVRAYLAVAGGEPVATAVAIRTGTTLGVYNIATVPEARGHGYGTAVTWNLMRDTEPGWEVAVLQASDMGRPIYERMGFQLVREFVEFGVAPSE